MSVFLRIGSVEPVGSAAAQRLQDPRVTKVPDRVFATRDAKKPLVVG